MNRNRCENCKIKNICTIAFIFNFCEDCKHYMGCRLRDEECSMGYEIECNNGFEDNEELEND